MAFVNVNNANFYYELHGNGQPLVLISGYSGDGRSWMPIVNELSNHFQILIFDNRGIGQTTDDGRELSIELMANDVVAICEKLQFNKPHIVGRSMGGNIVQSIASRYPDKINKIGILVSSAKWRVATLMALDIQLKMQEQGIDSDICNEHANSWLLGNKFLSDNDLLESLKLAPKNQQFLPTLTNLRRQLDALNKFNGLNQLNKIQAPAFIAYGAEDIMALPQDSRLMASNIPNHKIVEFECGHLIVLEQTAMLINKLLDFLKS